MITRRCAQRQFLLRPGSVANNAFAYCLADAARRTGVELLSTIAMSNHHHTIIYDRHGRYPEFLEHFHKLLARCLNAHRGRFENLWSSEQCSVLLLPRADVIDKLVYVATNAVNAHLVEQAFQWPGVDSFKSLRTDTAIVAHRPHHFFRATGKMPATLELRFVIPPELEVSHEEVVRTLGERIAAAEATARAARREKGTRVVGRRHVLRQPWSATPTSREPRFNLHPRVAGKNKWARIEALRRNQDFVVSYRCARSTLLRGEPPIPFPAGTYWLRRFARVTVAANADDAPTPG